MLFGKCVSLRSLKIHSIRRRCAAPLNSAIRGVSKSHKAVPTRFYRHAPTRQVDSHYFCVGTPRFGHAKLARAFGRAALAVAPKVYLPGASAPLSTARTRKSWLPFKTT